MLKNKTFWIGFVVLYVLAHVGGYLVHQLMLADTYEALSHVWRPEAEMNSKMWLFFLTSAVYTFLFCYIFVKGREGGGIMEGVRFGVIMGLFMSFTVAFESWVLYPIPLSLAVTWFVSGLVMSMIFGAVFAAIYRPAAST